MYLSLSKTYCFKVSNMALPVQFVGCSCRILVPKLTIGYKPFLASARSWAAFDVDGDGNLEMNATGGQPPSMGMMMIMESISKVLAQKDAEDQKEREDAMKANSGQTLTTQDTTETNEEPGHVPATSSSAGTTLTASTSNVGMTLPTEMLPKSPSKKSKKKSKKGKGHK